MPNMTKDNTRQLKCFKTHVEIQQDAPLIAERKHGWNQHAYVIKTINGHNS